MMIRKMFSTQIKLKFASEIPTSFETSKMTFCKAINNTLRLTLENNQKYDKKRIYFRRRH